MKRSLRAIVNLKVRMREPLRASVERAADKRGISMNAEIIKRLERTFRDDEIAARLDLMERRILGYKPK